MKAKLFFGAVVVFLIAMAFAPVHKHDFRSVDEMSAKMTAGFVAEAQAPQPGSGNVVIATANTTGTGSMTLLPAPTKTNRNYITQILCVNTSATTQTAAQIQSNGTTIAVVGCPPASSNQGTTIFPVPFKQPDVATALTVSMTAGATTVYVTMQGFTAR